MAAPPGEDPISADQRAQRLVGSVHGIIIAAAVLAVSGADDSPDAVDAGV